ncbi:MAG TPA: hypothetical protein VG838_12990 [Opitutaceae bacterium]|nr:hypothetical protein [Opitutaceae bacterium]
MRSLPFALLLSLAAAAPAWSAANLDVVHVWPGYRKPESFDRIADYFHGGEDRTGETVRRSQSAERAGFYFLVRLKNPGPALAAASFELKVVTPDSPKTRTFTFQADLPAGTHAFDLGLTGADWAGPKVNPVAWQLTVRSPDGAELARQQSFLWAEPPAAH